MKRLPLAASFLMFIALCASVAYWAMQLFKPPVRPVAAPPRVAAAEVRPEAAAGLFGGRSGPVAVASNYQLRGVIFSGSPRDSIAILSADGKPAQAVRVGMEVVPGVKVKEVHREYVLLSEGGATKRVELPENAKGQDGLAMTPTPARNGAVPNQPSTIGRPPQLTPPSATTPTPPATTAPTTAPPTMVVSPPPSQTVPSGGAIGNTAAIPPTPSVPAAAPAPSPVVPAQPMPQSTAAEPTMAPGITNQAQPTMPVAPVNPVSPPQPYVPFTGRVPPGTPGPSAPLQSR